MDCFVICRVINHEGDDGNDYLVEDHSLNGYKHWTESPALAKWYHSEEEAQEDLDHWSKEYPVCEIRPFDPVERLLHPTGIDRTVLTQKKLREMLRG